MKCCILLANLLVVVMSPHPARPVGSEIAIIEASTTKVEPDDAIAALDAIRQDQRTLEASGFARLCAIPENPSIHGVVRLAALRVICVKANAGESPQVVALMERLTESYFAALEHNTRSPAFDPLYESARYLNPALIQQFLAEGARDLSLRLQNQEILLQYCLDIALRSGLGDILMRHAAVQAIAESTAGVRTREDYIYRYIQASPNWRAPEALFVFMDAAFANRIRAILFGGSQGNYALNHCALDMLADYGDVETAGRIKDWIDLQPNRDELRNRYGVVGGHIWMIEAQHSPQMLLDHIRSGEWINYETRLWALRKAMKLGMDKADIRAAILEHATHADRDDRLWSTMRYLKKRAIREGVLGPEELPEIDLPSDDPVQEFRSTMERGRRRTANQSP